MQEKMPRPGSLPVLVLFCVKTDACLSALALFDEVIDAQNQPIMAALALYHVKLGAKTNSFVCTCFFSFEYRCSDQPIM